MTAKTYSLCSTRYEKSACSIGVVHLGFGAFHRAHQAVYFDDYMEKTGDLNWGIAAVNLRGTETDAFNATRRADGGYLLKTTAPDATSTYRLVRSHIAFEDWSSDAEAAEKLLTLPSVHAVTLTVTESGYYLDKDGDLNPNDPTIAAELLGLSQSSVYAFLANALTRRMAAGGAAISILDCDNVRHNGQMLARNFAAYLALTGQSVLAGWVASNVRFPSSMVDRITPRTTAELTDEINRIFPDHAQNPIQSEAFSQWVLEDDFAGPFPDLTLAGVTIVKDVDPFEEAKIRILNGGHTALVYLGALAGHTTFDQTMADRDLRRHFDAFQKQEVLPALTIELPFDPLEYLGEITARFGNTSIADSIERICVDGYAKAQIFIRPTLEGCLDQGIEPTHGYRSVASWYVFARRVAAGHIKTKYHEPNWAALNPLLVPGAESDFANARQLWSDLPERFPGFAPALVAAIKEMDISWPV